jgi:hypothetical protein
MATDVRIVLLLLALGPGCAASSPGPAAGMGGTGTVRGHVRLVPPEGVPRRAPGGSYGDRRLRDVSFVDYEKPGFAVVYLDGAPAPQGQVRLTIRSSRFGVRLEPQHAVIGVGGRIVIANASPDGHVISCPAAQILRRIGAGEEAEIPAPAPGAQPVFLVDVPGPQAVVFVAPGPYAAVSARGRFELRGVPPGPGTLRAWHPRFPPAARDIDVTSDRILQADLEMRIGGADGGADDPR